MTAIDYLIKEMNALYDNKDISDTDRNDLIVELTKAAKFKERFQIEDAYRFGKLNCYQVTNGETSNITATDYYEDKYSDV
jgi:hypothetical protein